jgi:hypothetical protein
MTRIQTDIQGARHLPSNNNGRIGMGLMIGGAVALALSMVCLGLANRYSSAKLNGRLINATLGLFFPGLLVVIVGAGLRACSTPPQSPDLQLGQIQRGD